MADMLVKLTDLPNQNDYASTYAAQGIRIIRAMAPDQKTVVDWVETHFGQMCIRDRTRHGHRYFLYYIYNFKNIILFFSV